MTKLQAEATQYQIKELEALTGQSEQIDTQLERVRNMLEELQTSGICGLTMVSMHASSFSYLTPMFVPGGKRDQSDGQPGGCDHPHHKRIHRLRA